MAASPTDKTSEPKRSPRRRRWWWWLVLGSVPILVALGSWWITEPFEAKDGKDLPEPEVLAGATEKNKKPARPPLVWPTQKLEGNAAKILLLDALLVASEKLSKVPGYTATFRKQERLRGTLGPVQTLAMKVRHQPFALYFKFLSPQAGKEVVYAEGHRENKVIAHAGGLSRLLVPRLAVRPDHPLALADSRHPVTEAGLANLTTRLVKFRRMDLEDADAKTILDRVTDADGHDWLRSVHLHTIPEESRPFARIEVLYEPESFIPMQIRSFDWPIPGQSEELQLAEHYIYENVNFDSELSARDFDPANPDYAFHRF